MMTRTLASLAIALMFVAGASAAHADGSLMAHGYQGVNYGGGQANGYPMLQRLQELFILTSGCAPLYATCLVSSVQQPPPLHS